MTTIKSSLQGIVLAEGEMDRLTEFVASTSSSFSSRPSVHRVSPSALLSRQRMMAQSG